MRNDLFYRKKKIARCIVSLTFLVIQLHAVAQQNKKLYQDSFFAKYTDTTVQGYSDTKPYYIGEWERALSPSIKIIRKLSEQIAIIEVNSQTAFNLLHAQIKIAAANDNWKFQVSAKKRISKNNEALQRFIIAGPDIADLLTVLKNKSKEVTILFVDTPSHAVIIKCKTNYVIHDLLPLKEVIFIDIPSVPHIETGIIGYDRSFHGLNAVDYSIPGANGKNIVAGVKEQKMEAADLDLHKRVLTSPIEAATISSHATVIASIIGGAGNSFYDGRGIANSCTFFPSSFANLFADDAELLHTNKVTVQNHSYGTIIQQFYGAEAVSYDASTWLYKNFVPVFSAGNQGTSFAEEGPYANLSGYANITGNFKMAKNIITVGAIDNKGTVAPESSAGPVYDGRIVPQLIALGPNGTSDAAAVVSGTVAVMQQVYADSNSQLLPAASLIKAILYNSAEDIYNTGIDYKTGYGLLNSYASIKAIQQKKYDGGTLSQNQEWTKTIIVPVNAAAFKITLAWTDSTAAINNDKAIVNDLDLQVKETASGTIYKPWVLNTAANINSLASAPVRTRDSLNTAEQVSILLPAAGVYEIKVTGTSVSTVSLPFHIAFNTDTLNTFAFLSPQHAADVNRVENEKLVIKWKTFVADTNQAGSLYVSYTRGASWQLLEQSLKIYSNRYQWQIPDTNTTALLKMETSFGVFLSKEFIIGTVNRPVVDFVCTDSFRLSWNKYVYANGYRIFTLTDNPYLQPILTVADTFVVLKRSLYPSLVYAVEPLLSNGLPAARSVALDIELQGVNCFYKTLNYDLLDYNRLKLLLELSITDYADSVFFEKLSSAGQLLQNYGGAKVVNNTLVYSQLVNEVAAGITYLRGRIKLKTGAIVYTDIIPVLTSGKQAILFYPNPVKRSIPLQYKLQQGIYSSSSQLQLFDIYGRLLKNYSSVPDQIDVSGLPAGVIVFKLLNSENRTLETGKLLIQ